MAESVVTSVRPRIAIILYDQDDKVRYHVTEYGDNGLQDQTEAYEMYMHPHPETGQFGFTLIKKQPLSVKQES